MMAWADPMYVFMVAACMCIAGCCLSVAWPRFASEHQVFLCWLAGGLTFVPAGVVFYFACLFLG